LTSKVIEADSGVFTLGMAVAPVTDWRFYDSVRTVSRDQGDTDTTHRSTPRGSRQRCPRDDH
jgi:dipeptidyl aminopeptidase/acylaminoacyl peptidase